MARVNAYLYLLRNGKPENPKYNTDYDLLPTKHPKSTRKTNAVLITKETEVNLVDNLQETIDFAVEDTVNEDDVIETKASSARTESEPVRDDADMKWDKDGNKVMAEHPESDPNAEDMPDDEEDMLYPKEDDMVEDMPKNEMGEHMPDDDKKMSGHDDDKKMSGHDDDEEDMKDPKDDEDAMSLSKDVAGSNEDDDDAEKATKSSDASFTESEKQELERFRREEKEKVLNSYKEFLSETVYEEFNTTLDSFNRDTLERELKVKVADYFMAQAEEIKKAKELESNKGFKTLQVINQLKDKDLASDISKLVDKYKK